MSSGPPADSGTVREPQPGDSSLDHREAPPDDHSSSIFDGDDVAGSSAGPVADFHREDVAAGDAALTAPPDEPVAVEPAHIDEPAPWMPPGGSSIHADSGMGVFAFGEAPRAETLPEAPYPVPLPYVAAVNPQADSDPAPAATVTAAPVYPRRYTAAARATSAWIRVYAVVATLLLAYLIYEIKWGRFDRFSELENLPDIMPNPLTTLIDTSGEHKNPHRIIIPRGADMPLMHTLHLGQTRRFGSVLVTPLRVTRGPLAFEEESELAPTEERDEVLKLWLRFENVSEQTFAPLDQSLLSLRGRTVKDIGEEANSFVTRLDEKRDDGDAVLMFDPSPYVTPADWNIGASDDPRMLGPGESLDVYLPTEEYADLSELTGDLVWRVHFRKGIADTGRGVTTLIEVLFHSDEIEPDARTI